MEWWTIEDWVLLIQVGVPFVLFVVVVLSLLFAPQWWLSWMLPLARSLR